MYAEDAVAHIREQFSADFALLVRHLVVEDCPPNWRSIRWEILNSYVIRDWERALDLYGRAEKLGVTDPVDIQLMRGQFRFRGLSI